MFAFFEPIFYGLNLSQHEGLCPKSRSLLSLFHWRFCLLNALTYGPSLSAFGYWKDWCTQFLKGRGGDGFAVEVEAQPSKSEGKSTITAICSTLAFNLKFLPLEQPLTDWSSRSRLKKAQLSFRRPSDLFFDLLCPYAAHSIDVLYLISFIDTSENCRSQISGLARVSFYEINLFLQYPCNYCLEKNWRGQHSRNCFALRHKYLNGSF